MDERRVHVYASGHGFVVVPVCQQPDETWIECEPAQQIGLDKALPITALLSRALEESAQIPCDELHPWDGAQGRWWAHHLYLARLTWQADGMQLAFLRDERPASPAEPAREWPVNVLYTQIAHTLIVLLGQALE